MKIKKIESHLHDTLVKPNQTGGNDTNDNVSPLADKLGEILFGAEGNSIRGSSHNQKNNRGGGISKNGPSLSLPKSSGFEVVDGVSCALFNFDIYGDIDNNVQIEATPGILIDDGGSPAEGQDLPRVIRWKTPDGREIQHCDVIDHVGTKGTYEVSLSLPDELAVKLSVSIVK